MTAIPRQASAGTSPEEWITRSREGDRDAFRALYELHFGSIRRMARYMGTPPEEAEDVVQEVFVLAYSRLAQFQGGNFGHWLRRICANVVNGRQRRWRVRDTLNRLFGTDPEAEVDRGPSPAQHSEHLEAKQQVAEILARMRPKHSQVFALFELEGLSGEEIAELVGCPVNTVWTRLYHARQQFERIGRKRGWIDSGDEP